MKSMANGSSPSGYGRGETMAERLGLGPEVRELKLGPTFTGERAGGFHTLKYDFKPASVDLSKMATVDVGTNNTMTVTVPHLDGAGIPHTVFRGSQRPYSKECVLIIDRITGEITLERLSTNIQVKKTRVEPKHHNVGLPGTSSGTSTTRPQTPVDTTTTTRPSPPNGRSSTRTKVISGKKREPKIQLASKQPSPMNFSPYYNKNSPSPPLIGPSTHPSLPMIGIDVDDCLPPPPQQQQPTVPKKSPIIDTTTTTMTPISRVSALSDSSSSSSSSSSSDSDSDDDNIPNPITANGRANGHTPSPNFISMPDNLLNEDLQLSESETDSD